MIASVKPDTTPDLRAWAAGVVESRGHLGWWRRPEGMRRHLTVGSRHRDVLAQLKHTYGGSIGRVTGSRQYRWTIGGRGLARLLEDVGPSLRVRGEELHGVAKQ